MNLNEKSLQRAKLAAEIFSNKSRIDKVKRRFSILQTKGVNAFYQ